MLPGRPWPKGDATLAWRAWTSMGHGPWVCLGLGDLLKHRYEAVLLCKAPNSLKYGFIPDSKREDPAQTDSLLLATRPLSSSYPHCIVLVWFPPCNYSSLTFTAQRCAQLHEGKKRGWQDNNPVELQCSTGAGAASKGYTEYRNEVQTSNSLIQ
jgi:hypothetical protein